MSVEQKEVLAMLHNIIANHQEYTTWTVSTPHLVMLVNKVVEAEREAVLQTIEALYNTQDPNPMYQEGYNHALDNLKEFVKARGQT